MQAALEDFNNMVDAQPDFFANLSSEIEQVRLMTKKQLERSGVTETELDDGEDSEENIKPKSKETNVENA